jgi:hypothetical protein
MLCNSYDADTICGERGQVIRFPAGRDIRSADNLNTPEGGMSAMKLFDDSMLSASVSGLFDSLVLFNLFC